jgi:hypothetical protein
MCFWIAVLLCLCTIAPSFFLHPATCTSHYVSFYTLYPAPYLLPPVSCALQAEVMHHDQSLIYAEDYIRDKPEIMVNRVVQHIQYLFEIKALSGVLPRLNQVRRTLCCVLCAVHYVLFTVLCTMCCVGAVLCAIN